MDGLCPTRLQQPLHSTLARSGSSTRKPQPGYFRAVTGALKGQDGAPRAATWHLDRNRPLLAATNSCRRSRRGPARRMLRARRKLVPCQAPAPRTEPWRQTQAAGTRAAPAAAATRRDSAREAKEVLRAQPRCRELTAGSSSRGQGPCCPSPGAPGSPRGMSQQLTPNRSLPWQSQRAPLQVGRASRWALLQHGLRPAVGDRGTHSPGEDLQPIRAGG